MLFAVRAALYTNATLSSLKHTSDGVTSPVDDCQRCKTTLNCIAPTPHAELLALLQQAVPPLFPWVPPTLHHPLSPQQEEGGEALLQGPRDPFTALPHGQRPRVRNLSGALLWTCRCWA